MNKLSKISFWLVRAGLFLAALTPLLVFRDTVYLYLIGKVTVFQALIEVIFPFFLYLAFTDKKYRPRINVIFYALGIYFATIVLSAIFGVNPGRSFWGYRDRMDGIFTMFHFLAFFAMLAGMFKTRKDWFLFLNAVFFSGLLVAFDYIARLIGANLDAGRLILPRLEGVLGNVIFFASFVLFQVFVAAILFFCTENKKLKIFYGAGALLFSAAVCFSLTRGAIIALLAGAVIAGLWLGFHGGRRWRAVIMAGILAVTAAGAIGWLARDTKFILDRPALNRIFHTSFSEGTGETRLLAWRAAWNGFLSKPVLGWGYVNFYAAFDKNYEPELLRHSPSETWFDRAHNIVFENLTTGGIVVSLAYLALLVSAVFVSVKKKNFSDGFPAIGYQLAGLGIIAYFVQNLFSVDHFGSYFLFYIFLGFLSVEAGAAEPRKLKLSGPGFIVVAAAVILGMYLAYNVNYKTLSLSREEFKAVIASSEKIDRALALYHGALSIKTPYTAEAKISFARSVIGGIERASFNEDEKRPVLLSAKNELDETALNYSRKSAYDSYIVGRTLSEWGKYEPDYFAKGLEYLNRARELSPRRQQIYFGIGRAKALEGDVPGAVAVFKEMINLSPTVPQSHWYAGTEYNNLGLPEAADEIITAYRLGFSLREGTDIQVVIAAMKYKNDIKDLPNLYELWYSWDRTNASILAELAALYAQLGEREKARAAAEKAMSLDPSFVEEGKVFLKSLGY